MEYQIVYEIKKDNNIIRLLKRHIYCEATDHPQPLNHAGTWGPIHSKQVDNIKDAQEFAEKYKHCPFLSITEEFMVEKTTEGSRLLTHRWHNWFRRDLATQLTNDEKIEFQQPNYEKIALSVF